MKTDEVVDQVLPQIFPRHWLEPPGIVYSDFPSRICIGYVLRKEGCYSYLVDAEFSALSIRLEELHAAALRNLELLPAANISIGKVPNGAEGWIWAPDDNFAAVRILLPSAQEIFRQELGEDFLVSLAHRDDCFCWSLAQPAERQEQHAKDALAAFLTEEYNLTPDIFLCSHGSFQLQRQQDPSAASDSRPDDEREKLLERVRSICLSMPETSEHEVRGNPTFFAGKRVFAGFGKVIAWGQAIRFNVGPDRREKASVV